MDQAVSPFSDVYTHLAELTGLPRKEVKEAVIAIFYGVELGDSRPVWKTIVETLREKARNELDEDGNPLWID